VHFETTITIDAPHGVVWNTLIDVDHWPDWTESIQRVTWLDGAGLAPGSRVRIKQPRMPSLVWVVSECEPGVSFTWRSVSPGITTVGTHVLEETAGPGVNMTLGVEQSGPLAPVIAPLTAPRTRRYVQMEADGLKRRSEAGA
jgi:uncharacterized membrane protein